MLATVSPGPAEKNKLVVLVQPSHGIWDGVFIRVPESILAVAALPVEKGYDVRIIDQRVDKNWEQQLINLVKQKPICVGVTSLTGPSLQYALNSMEIAKNTDPDVPIVFGGVHATLLPDQCIEQKWVDIVAIGDADFLFLQIIEALENETSLETIKGVAFEKNGSIVNTGAPDMVMDMDSLADSPYHLLDMNQYSATEVTGKKSIAFQTSRGCPFKCKFCGNERLQDARLRMMSIPKLISKIKFLQNTYGYETFLFVDDLTTASPSHFRKMVKAFLELEKPISWNTVGIRADLIARLDDEDLELAYESGLRAMDVGIESGSDEMIKYIQKGEDKARMRQSNDKLAKVPIKVKYTFIIGYPNETEEQRNETLDFYLELSKANPHCYPMIFVYVPIVGTALYNELVASGWQPPEKMEDWIHMDFREWMYNYDNWWIPNGKEKEFELIMISSLFCNKNARQKLAGASKRLTRLAFDIYHPIAKLRFIFKFFKFPIETYLVEAISRLRSYGV